MKPSHIFTAAIIFCLVCASIQGCSVFRSKAKGGQTSTPGARTIESGIFSLEVQPAKKGGRYFGVFRLEVRNRSEYPVEIDWNLSRYFLGEKDVGGFLFQGISPGRLKNGTVPNSVVQGESELSLEVVPFATVEFIKQDYSSAIPGTGVYTGILPRGKNSLLLVLRHGRDLIGRSASFEISDAAEQGGLSSP